MPKKKNSVALFEVIHKAGEKRRVAGSVGVQRQQTRSAGAGEGDALQQALPRPAGIANGKFGAPKRPTIWREGGRLNLSLGAVTGSVVAIGLLTLLAFVFLAGRWSAPAATVTTAQTGILTPSGGGPGDSQQPERVSGKYYHIIQNLGVGVDPSGSLTAEGEKLLKEADDVVKFLKQGRIPATVNSWKGKYIVVLSLDGFDGQRTSKGWDLARRIESLGKNCPGRWKLRQRNAQGQFDPTFIRWP